MVVDVVKLGVTDGVMLVDVVKLAVTDGVAVVDGVNDGVTDAVRVMVVVVENDMVPVPDGLIVRVVDDEMDTDADSDADAVYVCVNDGDAVSELLPVAEPVMLVVDVPLTEPLDEPVALGDGDGDGDGHGVWYHMDTFPAMLKLETASTAPLLSMSATATQCGCAPNGPMFFNAEKVGGDVPRFWNHAMFPRVYTTTMSSQVSASKSMTASQTGSW
jgi:hypothetical protein